MFAALGKAGAERGTVSNVPSDFWDGGRRRRGLAYALLLHGRE